MYNCRGSYRVWFQGENYREIDLDLKSIYPPPLPPRPGVWITHLLCRVLLRELNAYLYIRLLFPPRLKPKIETKLPSSKWHNFRENNQHIFLRRCYYSTFDELASTKFPAATFTLGTKHDKLRWNQYKNNVESGFLRRYWNVSGADCRGYIMSDFEVKIRPTGNLTFIRPSTSNRKWCQKLFASHWAPCLIYKLHAAKWKTRQHHYWLIREEYRRLHYT